MSVDPAWKGVYRAGGLSLLLAGILFIISFLRFLIVGPEPSTSEEVLKNLGEQKLFFQIISGIFTFASILLIPAVFAVYLALKEVKRTHILIATGLAALGIPLLLGSIIVNYSLVTISNQYRAATSETQRVAYVAAADLVSGASGAGFLLSIILFSVAVLITSLVMLKGIFSKGTAYLGMATGIVGLVASIGVAVPALQIVGFVSLLLFATWFLAVGSKLYKLGSGV